MMGKFSDETENANEGDLRVWWIPQVPMKPFHVPVKDHAQAILILGVLADYDQFQFKNNIKPDYCNAGGLEMFDDDGWSEWCDPASGDQILDLMDCRP